MNTLLFHATVNRIGKENIIFAYKEANSFYIYYVKGKKVYATSNVVGWEGAKPQVHHKQGIRLKYSLHKKYNNILIPLNEELL